MNIQRKKFLNHIIENYFNKPFMITFDDYGVDRVEEVKYMFDKVYGRDNYSFIYGEDPYLSPKRRYRINIYSVGHKDGGYFETLDGDGYGQSWLPDGRIIDYTLHNYKLK